MWCNMESKNDNIMLTLGIVILLVALMGTAVFEGEQPADNEILWDVTFAEKSAQIEMVQDFTGEGQTTDVMIDIAQQTNITNLSFELRWTDDDTSGASGNGNGVVNQPDHFILTVQDPEGGAPITMEGENEIGQDGTILIVFDFPVEGLTFDMNGTTATGGSAEAVSEKLTVMNGMGNWSVTVECTEAGDAEDSLFGTTVEQDDGNAWTLDVRAIYYEATIKLHENVIGG
jgi:hypothetical protein